MVGQSTGAQKNMRGARHWGAWVTRFATSLVLACIPAILSIVNPHRYPEAPLFMPPAVRNVALVTVVAVPVIWLLAYRWSSAIVTRLFVTGLVLCGVTVLCLFIAGVLEVGPAGPFMFSAELLGTLAIPCVSLFGLLETPQKTEGTK